MAADENGEEMIEFERELTCKYHGQVIIHRPQPKKSLNAGLTRNWLENWV